MFRKVMIALAATATIAAAALTPTAASAKKWGGWHGHHHGHHWKHWGFYGAPIVVGAGYYGSCWAKKWVNTPYGPVLKKYYVCY